MKSPQEILTKLENAVATDMQLRFLRNPRIGLSPKQSHAKALSDLYELILEVIGEDEYQSNFQTRIYQVPEGVRELHVPVSEPITRNVFRDEMRERLYELFGRTYHDNQ